jgi:3-oxoacyl-[acyl-carrier protein] reductase
MSDDLFDLGGKVCLVTGGSRGLGRAIALALAGQGADVAINYRGNAEAGEEVAGQITALGRRALSIKGDTSAGREACEAIVKTALDGLGSVDILVNNAGITRDNLLMRMDAEEWDAVIDTNLGGPFWMTRAIARPMMKARSGRIINMSSAAGRMGNPGQANYAAAKAGLIGLTKTTARELASRGITCNAIAPGLIETDLTADLPAAATEALKGMTPLGYLGSVDDVAAAAVYFASDEARYVTGQVLGVDGGIVMGS